MYKISIGTNLEPNTVMDLDLSLTIGSIKIAFDILPTLSSEELKIQNLNSKQHEKVQNILRKQLPSVADVGEQYAVDQTLQSMTAHLRISRRRSWPLCQFTS
jgi:predicted flavoprotein YhiN